MLRILVVLALVLAAGAARAERAWALAVSLHAVSVDFADVEAELWLQWGANLAPARRQPGWLMPVAQAFDGGRRGSVLDLDPVRLTLPDDVAQVAVWGRLVDAGTRRPLRFVPVAVFDLTGDGPVPAAIEVRRDRRAAFQASYPFVFLSDTGFITDATIRPVLLSIGKAIEFSASVSEPLDDEEWQRIQSFFLSNVRYFDAGDAELVVEVLNHLRSLSATGGDASFKRFYAAFLNTILRGVADRQVGSASLHRLVLDDLAALYERSLAETFEQADMTLQSLEGNGYYLKCLDIASVMLAGMDRAFLEDAGAGLNLRSTLVATTRCGQLYFAGETGGSPASVAEAAQFLAGFALGRAVMGNFVRTVEAMDDMGRLRVTNRSDNLIGDYAASYRAGMEIG